MAAKYRENIRLLEAREKVEPYMKVNTYTKKRRITSNPSSSQSRHPSTSRTKSYKKTNPKPNIKPDHKQKQKQEWKHNKTKTLNRSERLKSIDIGTDSINAIICF